jgi:hypothetical protein
MGLGISDLVQLALLIYIVYLFLLSQVGINTLSLSKVT